MKTKILIIISFLFFLFALNTQSQDNETSASRNITTINSSQEMFPLASSWVTQYNTLNPQQTIKLEIKENSIANLSLVSSKSNSFAKETNWDIVLGRDIVVPVMNSGNPYSKEINSHGISPYQFSEIIKNPSSQTWGNILGGNKTEPVHIYVVNDETTLAAVSKFVNSTNIIGITLGTKADITAAVQNDPNAICFIKLNDISNAENQSLAGNLAFIPIDKNGNHSIDYMENIYADLNTFLRGVWIGKYPKSLYNTLYAISNTQPESKEAMAFLSWVITDGQRQMSSNGYCTIGESESITQMDKINASNVISKTEESSFNGTIMFILAIIVMFGLLTVLIFSYFKSRKQILFEEINSENIKSFDEKSIKAPAGIFFDKSHTWSFLEKDGSVSVGLDDFIQHVTGEITRVEMKNVGEKITKGDLLFSIIQEGKQLNICAPISGTILQKNNSLDENSIYLNSSPFTDGWVYKIEPTDWLSEIPFLMMAEKYKRWLNKEFIRVKDFMTRTLTLENQDYATIVLQDGGTIKDGILEDCGPKIWEDFQTNILDNNSLNNQCRF